MDQRHINDALQEYADFWNQHPQHSERWGYTFLFGDPRLDDDERNYLLTLATTMYLGNEKQRKVLTDSLEGKLSTDHHYDSLGNFGGQRFDAKLEKDCGTIRIRFLVSEQTGAQYKSYAVN